MRVFSILIALVLYSPSVFATYDAEEISRAILNDVKSNSELGPCDISVEVGRGRGIPFVLREGELDRGVVRVVGTVSSERDRTAILEIARNTDWVHRVEDKLTVGTLPGAMAMFGRESAPDDRIQADVKEIIKRNFRGSDQISVVAQNGVVTLSGDLPNHREVDRVLAMTLMVPGVNDISSELTVGGRGYPTASKAAIK